MKEKPKIIMYMAGVILLVPLMATLLVYFGTHFHRPLLSRELILNFGMLCLGALFVSYGVWKVRSWGFYILIAFGVVVVSLDLQQIITNPKSLNFWHFVDGGLVLLGLGIIFQEKIKAPYFNPKVRWWERASRHRTDVQGHFKVAGVTVEALILDLSTTGCFIGNDLPGAELGEVLDISIDYQKLHFESQAKIVRHGEIPKGAGLMFVETNHANRKVMKKILEEIVKQTPAVA